ncbi:MAG: nitroreductase family protein, partial [Pseudomonadota bacterium]
MFEGMKQAYLPKTRFPKRAVDREKCEKCGRCVTACPTGGIIWGGDGFPEPIGFGGFDQACINCWNCVAMCPTDALSMEGSYQVEAGRYRTMTTGRMSPPDPLGNGQPWKKIEPELTEVEKVLYKRRSNRLFKKKAVDRALLTRVLEAGRFAPSGGNNQPYKFIVITDQAVIHEVELGAIGVLKRLKNLYLAKDGKRRLGKSSLFTMLSLFMVNKMDPRPFTAMDKAEKDQALYWHAPAIIILCKNTRGIANPDLDIGICAQN